MRLCYEAMPTVQDVLDAVETIAPTRFAFDFDHIGLQIGWVSQQIERAVVSLDPSIDCVRFASKCDAHLLLSHHSIIWDPLKILKMSPEVPLVASIYHLIENQIAFIGSHTNWDCAEGGINDTLCQIFGLTDVARFGSKPSEGIHCGRIGSLPEKMSLRDFQTLVDSVLNTRCMVWQGAHDGPIERVAIVGGAADGEAQAALEIGADVFLTGEVRHDVSVSMSGSPISLVAGGHFATENPGMREMTNRLRAAMPEIDWLFFEPEPGNGGRPF